jgi:hypothetical protein
MKAIKFIDNSEGKISIQEYEKSEEDATTYKWFNSGMVNTLIASALQMRHGVDLVRLHDKDIEHIMKMANHMLLMLKNECNYLIDEFYTDEKEQP